MKKIFIAALFLATGIIVSCTKEMIPQTATATTVEHNTSPFIKDIGTAD
ncbi:hypothetical protein [Mucilaginibacter gilvus]|nr:hypothetical protein [Mucilaginibacter gilvus]